MILFPNCKINLGLNIVGKRDDGYHDIETVFYPLPLHDAVEVVQLSGSGDQAPAISNQPSGIIDQPSGISDQPSAFSDQVAATEQNNPAIHFTGSGIKIEGREEDNLCIKAYRLLQKQHQLPVVKIHLHKAIPTGAGLGGGSADGAFTLKLLNEIFQLNLSQQRLLNYALQLGSDCPFFIINKPCFATGRGEILEDIPLSLSNYHFVIVNPGIYVHTGRAFSHIKPTAPQKSIRDIIKQPVITWKHELLNDFERVVSQQYDAIKNIKTQLYKKGALYASMTGTGSTVYGIFENATPGIEFPEDYTVVYL